MRMQIRHFLHYCKGILLLAIAVIVVLSSVLPYSPLFAHLSSPLLLLTNLLFLISSHQPSLLNYSPMSTHFSLPLPSPLLTNLVSSHHLPLSSLLTHLLSSLFIPSHFSLLSLIHSCSSIVYCYSYRFSSNY